MAAAPGARIVRLAELEIDPRSLAAYRAALAEEVAASLREEPGVLRLDAISLDDKPTQIRILEVYADQASYEAHLRSPHFLRYKAATQGMIRRLALHETTPIAPEGASHDEE